MVNRNNHARSSALPPAATLRALEEQLSPELSGLVRRYAEARVSMLRLAGKPMAKSYARELADDSIANTWTGAAPWDPARCSLLVHLRGAVRQRTWQEVVHAFRVTRVSLDEPANDETGTLTQVEHALAEAQRGDCCPIKLRETLTTVCQDLRSLAGNDDDAMAILECWDAGTTERQDVLSRAGLADDAYDRARERLFYMSRRHLPPELREVVTDLLRNAS